MSDLSNRIASLSPEKRAALARRLQGTSVAAPAAGREPLAIVGIGCRLPGAGGPDAFWTMLENGTDAITEVPRDRWKADEYYDADPAAAGKMATRWGGFVADVDRFDAEFFGIVPREAERMDPQQRLLLETTWEALEQAGRPAESIAGGKVGVFVGIHSMSSDYYWSQARDLRSVDPHTSTGVAHSIAANRISYLLDLRGPSIAVDTACSSSLVAVHLACQSLRAGECDTAVAGGVNLILSPEASVAFSKLRMMAADGRCKTFDARADGFVRGEGCGVVVLRRLSEAVKDGDRILAVIRGSAVNQDGATNGLTAPNGLSQQDVVRQALRDGNLDPARITFIETHGTGTALGDPIEVESLAAVIGQRSPDAAPCVLGALKTNIGHLEAAAGIAGLIKVVLCLQHRHIPANLHFRSLNGHISIDGTRLALAESGGAWLPGSTAPRCAGVSSFGFGGTNAHVILEEFVPETAAPAEESSGGTLKLLPLSARTREALKAHAQHVVRWLEEPSAAGVSTHDIAYTAGARRSHYEYRRAVVGATHEEWRTALQRSMNGQSAMHASSPIIRPWPGLAFVYSGQGPQWAGMGLDLYRANVAFRAALDRCDAEFRRHADWSLPEELARPEATSRLNQTSIAQPAIFAIQYALTEMLRGWGVGPDAVVGHSAGEVAAACTAGALTFVEAARLVVLRGRLMERAAGRGAMAALELPPDEAEAALAGCTDRIDVAAFNSPTSTVISGDPSSVDAVVDTLKGQGVFAKRLSVNYAFHSRQMEELQPELVRELSHLRPARTTVPIASTVTGRLSDGSEHNAQYWSRNMREPVRFCEAVQALIASGHRVFLELSPHSILASMVARCGGNDIVAVGSLRRDAEGLRGLLESIGRLYESGLPLDFARLDDARGHVVELPAYPWQRSRHWFTAPARATRMHERTAVHPLLGRRLSAAVPIFENELTLADLPSLQDHRAFGRAFLPAAAFVEMTRAAAALTRAPQGLAVQGLSIERALVVPDDAALRVQTTVVGGPGADREVQIFSAAGEGDAWTRHAVASVADAPAVPSDSRFDLAAARDRCRPVELADHYERLQTRGLWIGPSFRTLETLMTRDGEALARVVAGTSTDMVDVHTAWLDGCLQPLVAAAGDRTCLFTGVQRLVVWGEPGPVWSHAVVSPDPDDPRRLTGTVRAYADDGSTRLEAEGVALTLIDDAVRDAAVTVHGPIEAARYEIQWRPAPPPAIPDAGASIAPSPDAIADLRREHQLDAYERLVPQLESLSAAFVLRAFHELGWKPALRDRVSVPALIASLGIVPAHHRLFGRLCGILEEEGILRTVADAFEVVQVPATGSDALDVCRRLRTAYPMCDAELSLLERCGAELGSVLAGRRDALQILFPQGSFEAVERLYRDAPFSRVDNTLLQRALSRVLAGRSDDRPLRILEVGAGTGGSTMYTLPVAASAQAEYVFTDVSQIFLIRARQKFRDTPGLRFEILDIERDPREQGFAGRQFDVVIAANVLHATADLRRTVGHVRELLAPGGQLLLLEVTRPQRWIDLTFGLTEGWWRFADSDLRPTRALLTPPEWLSLLNAEGFEGVTAIPDAVGLSSQESVIAGRRVAVAAVPRPAGRWLLVAEEGAIAGALAARMRAHGDAAVVVSHVPARFDAAETDRSTAPWRGIVYLRGVDEAATEPASVDDLLARQTQLAADAVRCSSVASGAHGARVWFITRGAQSPGDGIVHTAASALWGLGRGIAIEQPDTWGGVIDVDGDAWTIADHILAELTSSDGEDQVAWRDGRRYVPRLTPVPDTTGPAVAWHPDAAYLVTGGLGGVGVLVARALAERGVRHLVLTGRTTVAGGDAAGAESARRARAVEEIRALGAEVTVAAVDVADEAGMAALFARFGTTLPRLAGVFHCAAALSTIPLRDLDRAAILEMYRAKIGGAWLLHQLTRERDLDCFVLFSSTTALIGATGLAHYAAANTFLDALAWQRAGAGLPALAVNWGTWEAMRLFSATEQEAVSRLGLAPMPADRAMTLLDRTLAERRTQLTIAAVNWAALKAAYEVRRARPLLRELGTIAAAPSESRPAASAPADLRRQLDAVAPSARRDLLVDIVRRTVAEVMGYPPDRPIDARQGFFDLGMDSLMTVDLRVKVGALAGCELPTGVTFNHPTVESLADFLATKVFALGTDGALAAPSANDRDVTAQRRDVVDEPPRTIEDTLSLLDAELAAVDDLVGN